MKNLSDYISACVLFYITPMNFWQGKLVRLRGVEPSDAPAFFEWNLDSEAARSLEFVFPPVSLAQVTSWTEGESLKKLENDSFTFVIEDTGQKVVGSIRTHNCNHYNGTFSYGIHVDAGERRNGIAADAIAMVLNYYFGELRYQKVTVTVNTDNDASIGLHEKLGFVKEGTIRRMFYSRGIYRDVHWYGLTIDEWGEAKLFRTTAE
jgi:RimJ/RimL family protein N-acetyltransferase